MPGKRHEPFEFEHSKAKRAILEGYLRPWLVVLGAAVRKYSGAGGFSPCYFDGFAGPGRGKNGELGSPLVALKGALAVMQNPPYEVRVHAVRHVFCEKDPDAFAELREAVGEFGQQNGVVVREARQESQIAQLLSQATQRGRVWAILWRGDFRSALHSTLSAIPDKITSPIFAFLDPTGYSTIEFDVVRAIMSRRWAELLLTFMSGHMERWCSDPAKTDAINKVFGTYEWRPGDWEDLAAQYVEALRSQIKTERLCACAYKVWHAQTNRRTYHLLHLSHHPKAAGIIKSIMWKESTPGLTEPGYFGRQHSIRSQMLSLFDDVEGAIYELRELLLDTYAGQEIRFDELEQRIECYTIYTSRQLKQAIKTLEAAGNARIENRPGKKGIHSDSVIIFGGHGEDRQD